MNIEVRDVITLNNDKEYVVCSKAFYEGKNYYYLVDKNDPTNLMFCYEEKNELVELQDKELTTQLLPLFYENGKQILFDIHK